ncbi:Mitogen-activated protein kinase-binding protein 1 [Fragariocoptes setiger]|uniref:Mitogen-activated protein kinase-binding protein 1 n=1 Tax=Fragariocoptes setiger TaxID=1670756 RepID=A0ABQ7SA29_9ACAR|nr:Mitogen-activated protein kinase-binding protein 1 [Fragariocoptes setiger]
MSPQNQQPRNSLQGLAPTHKQSLLQASLKKLDQERVTWGAITRAWLKNVAGIYYRTRNSIRNGMWPTSVNNLYMCCIFYYLIMVVEPSFCLPLSQRLWKYADHLYIVIPANTPEVVRAGIVSIISAFVSICVVLLVRQLLLRCLLSYRQWMYESMRTPPLKIILWGLLVRLISGYQPSLYSFQRSLPRLPVPPLSETMKKLLESLEPITSPEEFEKIKKQAHAFERNPGPKLQRLLVLKSWLTQNYVTDWWERYVYLRGRSPLANNCNYYIMDQSYWRATDKPVARAASLTFNIIRFKQLVDREELPPLLIRDTIPICMAQYERLFSTTRVPGKEFDELVHYDTKTSKHVIIICNGVFYNLTVYDSNNLPLSAKRIEEQIQWIMEDSEKVSQTLSIEEKMISSLTALERSDWANVRNKLIKSSSANRNSLELIESAIFCLWIFDKDKPEGLTDRAKMIFQGNSEYRLWFDKCFNVVVFGDGHCGINCEHSLCDAPAYAHMWEYTLCKDVLECTFDSDGYCFPPLQTYKQAKCTPPHRLVWSCDDSYLAAEVKRADSFSIMQNKDIDLRVIDHREWGKGAIKKCKISPDAFVQISLQLAYFKDSGGKFVQTYEASMTRLYLNGRTETVRSCTKESCEFVKAMVDPKKTKDEKIRLLQLAADKHTNLYKDAMNGKGIDRHLFALYVASTGLGYECDFLGDLLLNRPWILSTSQTPHTQQTNVPDPNYKNFNDKLCSGGGFMAVAENGYGVSYLFPNDHRIFFHITSRHSSPDTDTKRFRDVNFREERKPHPNKQQVPASQSIFYRLLNRNMASVQLEKVLGVTVMNANSFASHSESGNLFYAAGCVAVALDPRNANQMHILNSSKRTITALAVSSDGQYLATGECGNKALMRIWDIRTSELLGEFSGHKLEIRCVIFSPDTRLVVSIGSHHDMTINVWDWRKQLRVASAKVSTKIKSASFSASSSYFVTVGEGHVKYWYLHEEVNEHGNDTMITMKGHSAILGDKRNNNFCDVKCGVGLMSESTFCIARSGLLCEFNQRRLLNKWLDLRTTSANCLSVSEHLIAIGCADGILRCFNTNELKFLRNLPKPHALGTDIAASQKQSSKSQQQTGQNSYAHVVAVTIEEITKTISCIYSDRSIYVWDLAADTDRVTKLYSSLYHSSCIWGLDVYPNTTTTRQLLPPGTFITCSSDDTIRIWDATSSKTSSKTANREIVYRKNNCSSELLKIFYTDPKLKHICDPDCDSSHAAAVANCGSMSSVPDAMDTNNGIRCLRVSPDGQHLAAGSRSGTIRILDLSLDDELCNIAAHDSEVLCLEYSDPSKYDGYSYLASSSRDKLIHIFDVARNYAFVQTIDDHTSSITAVKFVKILHQNSQESIDNLKLISCGADCNIIFRRAIKSPEEGHLNFALEQRLNGKYTYYDMELDADSSCLITACQDRMIRLYNVTQAKYNTGFKGSLCDEGTLIKIALDPSGTFLATSCTDKSLHIYDYQRGECVLTIDHGHSDLITGIKFSNDGSRLMSVSGDGCIFVWSLPFEIANAIGETLGLPLPSMSSCSLSNSVGFSHNNGSTNNSNGGQTVEKLSSLPPWAKRQLAEEIGRSRSIQGSNTDISRYHVMQSGLSTASNGSEHGDDTTGVASSSGVATLSPNGSDDESSAVGNESNNSRHSDQKHHKFNGVTQKRAKYLQSRDGLDKILTREKYVKSNIMLFDTNGQLVSGNLDSASARHHNRVVNVSDHLGTDGNNEERNQTKSRSVVSKRREGLTRAINEARKKLETVSIRNVEALEPRGHSNKAIRKGSKSIADLKDLKTGDGSSDYPERDDDNGDTHQYRNSNQESPSRPASVAGDSVRRATSLSDLTNGPPQRLFERHEEQGRFWNASSNSNTLKTDTSYNSTSDHRPFLGRTQRSLSGVSRTSSRTYTIENEAENNPANDSSTLKSTPLRRQSNSQLWPPLSGISSLHGRDGLDGPDQNSGLVTLTMSTTMPSSRSNSSAAHARLITSARDLKSENSPQAARGSSDEDDELSSEDDRVSRARPVTPPKPTLLRQIRRNSSASHRTSSVTNASAGMVDMNMSSEYANPGQQQQLRHSNHNSATMGHSGRRSGTTAPTRRLWTQSSSGSTMRSSKSEHNLASITMQPSVYPAGVANTSRPSSIYGGGAGGSASVWSEHASTYSDKIDLASMNPATMPKTYELCQFVVDELQTVSRYAARLYQSLCSQPHSNVALRNLVGRGIEMSADLLAAVSQVAQQQQTMQAMAAAQYQQQQSSGASDISGPRVLSEDDDDLMNAEMDDTQANANSYSEHQRIGQESADAWQSPHHHNMDQVLAAYSDRLVELVQERMSNSQANTARQARVSDSSRSRNTNQNS